MAEGAELAELARVAGRFLHDDRALERDLQYIAQGYKIYYGVDYSEIHNYVFISQNSQVSYLNTIEPSIKKMAFDEFVLQEVFFSNRRSIFILPSHRLEMALLAETMPDKEMAELAVILSELTSENFVSDELRQYIELIRRPDAPELIRSQAAQKIVEEAAKNAPSLFLLARTDDAKPQRRYVHLLKNTNWGAIEGITSKKVAVPDDQDRIYNAAYKNFLKVRPEVPNSTNRIDAFAIAYLVNLSMSLKSGAIFRFITRSKHFSRVCKILVDDGIVESEIFDIVQHPRMFAMFKLADATQTDLNKLLSQRIRASEIFLTTYERHRSGGITEELSKKIRYEIEHIENIALVSDFTHKRRATKGNQFLLHTNVDKLVSLFQDKSEVKAALQQRAREVIDNANEQTIKVAEKMALGEIKEPANSLVKGVQENFVAKPGRAESVRITRFENHLVPYELEFYSKSISDRINQGKTAWAVLHKFASSRSLGNSYERRLAVSYLLALRREWDVSFLMSDSALFGNADDGVPRHEGYYFRAITRSCGLPLTEENIKFSIQDITMAIETKNQLLGYDYRDPRYLNEFAVQWRIAQLKGIEDVPSKFLMANSPLDLWEEVFERSDSISYQLNALNNICYYFVMEQDIPMIGKSLNRLINYAIKNSVLEQELPVGIIDTIIRARLLTNYYQTENDRLSAEQKLLDLDQEFGLSNSRA